jgi:hypothetical protein
MAQWQKQRDRLNAASRVTVRKLVAADKTKALLEAVLRPGEACAKAWRSTGVRCTASHRN